MATLFHNVTGSTGVDVTLLSPGDISVPIKSIVLTNFHSSNAATLTVFFEKGSSIGKTTKSYKVLNELSLPAKASLIIDDNYIPGLLGYNKQIYGLYLTVGASDTVDVLINV